MFQGLVGSLIRRLVVLLAMMRRRNPVCVSGPFVEFRSSLMRIIRHDWLLTSLVAYRDRRRDQQLSAARNGSDNQKRLGAGGHRGGQRLIRRLVGPILLAGEEAQEGAALQSDVIANRAAQHGIAGLERVERRAQRYG